MKESELLAKIAQLEAMLGQKLTFAQKYRRENSTVLEKLRSETECNGYRQDVSLGINAIVRSVVGYRKIDYITPEEAAKAKPLRDDLIAVVRKHASK
jgi:hypothetical protein